MPRSLNWKSSMSSICSVGKFAWKFEVPSAYYMDIVTFRHVDVMLV